MKRITVRIISYNQEDVIGRALDSLLQQKEWGLYRIVISDDSSQDRTWEILQKYQKEYPNIVFPYRNEKNLGIYENVEKADSLLPESDLYCELSGDDAYCDGYFKAVQELIVREKIDTNEAVGFYSDWKTISPEGKERVFKQGICLSGWRLWSLYVRGRITSRSVMYTKKVRNGFEPLMKGAGLRLKEEHYDSQVHLNIQKIYYIPIVTSIYYTGLGVSLKLKDYKSPYNTTECIECWNYISEHNVKDKYDFHLAQYAINKADFFIKKSIRKYIKTIYHYELSQIPICKDSLTKKLRTFIKLTLILFK